MDVLGKEPTFFSRLNVFQWYFVLHIRYWRKFSETFDRICQAFKDVIMIRSCSAISSRLGGFMFILLLQYFTF